MKKFILAMIIFGLTTLTYAENNTQHRDDRRAELQQKITDTHAQLETAQATLKKAEAAQAAGKISIGDFQFINDSSMQRYKQDVVSAKANYYAAINNYNRYVSGITD